ncbi:ASCH domain-containing protein [Candidatus Bathyarchaeota archaeon]|nr:MAG: ASCH domain-containing protein [Candidatus Bathyarchaeota archaeon]
MKIKQLNFKREYMQILKSGRKITTIRMRTDLKPGDIVELIAGGESCGYAKIKSITKKKVSELTKKDALKDGFKSKKELIETLKKYYSEITPESYINIISFEKIKLKPKRTVQRHNE